MSVKTCFHCGNNFLLEGNYVYVKSSRGKYYCNDKCLKKFNEQMEEEDGKNEILHGTRENGVLPETCRLPAQETNNWSYSKGHDNE